jgi:acyl-CoA hydrolase
VTFLASVNYTGRSSMEVGIRVVTENIRQRLVRHANSCYFTMVAVDEERKPVLIDPLELKTEDQRVRFEQALRRKQVRKAGSCVQAN